MLPQMQISLFRLPESQICRLHIQIASATGITVQATKVKNMSRI